MAVEHAMFNFESLKVNSRDDRVTDRMTTKVPSSRPRIKCGETNHSVYRQSITFKTLIDCLCVCVCVCVCVMEQYL